MTTSLALDHFHFNNEIFIDTVESFPFPIIIAKEEKGEIKHMYLNSQFIADIGYTLEEIPIIEDWYLKAYPNAEYRNSILNKWTDLFIEAKKSKKTFVLMEAQVTTKHFGELWFEVKVSMKDNMYFVAFVNIQDLVNKNEQLKQISLNKDKMLSLLSHDIRGPIGNLYSLSKMTLDHDLGQEEFLELLKSLNESSLRVLDLVETTVQWARSNFDDLFITFESVDMLNLVDEVLLVYESEIKLKEIKTAVEINESLMIKTDRSVLHTILRNIISNAIKFTPKHGSITIRSSGNRISITDTGKGMEANMIEKVLHSNYSSSLGTQKEVGIGIGLKLTRDLI